MIGSVLYRIALLAFPPAQRARHGDEMMACFDACRASRRGLRRLIYVARAVCDTFLSGIHMRLHPVADTPAESRKRVFSFATLFFDVRYALRTLRQRWRYSSGVVMSLALGLGLGIPVLSLADSFFLQTPPGITQPNRLMRLVVRGAGSKGPYFADGLTGLDYEVMRRRARTLSGVAAWMDLEQSLGTGPSARSISTSVASADYASVLGVTLVQGRWYTDAEDAINATQAPCVVSYAFWKSELGGRRDAIGRKLRIAGIDYEVAGVTSPEFHGMSLSGIDVWLPLHVAAPVFQGRDPELWTTDHSAWLRIAGRLKPGVTREAAQEEAAVLYRTSGERTRDRSLEGTLLWDPLQPGGSHLSNHYARISLWMSSGGVLLLLLVFANLVNLSLSRAAADSRQTAIRVAIGGSWSDLFRPKLFESMTLSIVAAAIGLFIAAPAVRTARSLLLPNVEWSRAQIDARNIAIGMAVAVVIALVTGIWTATRMSKTDPSTLLRGGASSRGRAAHTLRRGLLVVQAAIFAMLLTGSIAFVTSLRRAASVNLGFDPAHVLAADIPLDSDVPRAMSMQIEEQAAARVAALPSVEAVTLSYMEPGWNNTYQPLAVPGYTGELPTAFFDMATPDYLTTFGVRMLRGRWIADSDRATTEPVIVVNDAFARAVWPGSGAIGRCVMVGKPPQPCRTVVGVADNMIVTGRVDEAATPIYYVPVAQSGAYVQTPKLFIRPRGAATAAAVEIRRVLQQISATLPAVDVHPVSRSFTWITAPLRLGAAAFTAFGLLAAVIAAIGLHGMASFVVAEQRRSAAIRVALGARPTTVSLPILLQSVATVCAGLVIGFALLLPVSRVLQPILFHAHLFAPGAIAGVTLLAVLVSAAAAAAPVRSLQRTDVVRVLRDE